MIGVRFVFPVYPIYFQKLKTIKRIIRPPQCIQHCQLWCYYEKQNTFYPFFGGHFRNGYCRVHPDRPAPADPLDRVPTTVPTQPMTPVSTPVPTTQIPLTTTTAPAIPLPKSIKDTPLLFSNLHHRMGMRAQLSGRPRPNTTSSIKRPSSTRPQAGPTGP